MVGENAPWDGDWSVPPTQHCGEWCFDRACNVCGEYVPATVPANIELGGRGD